MQTTPQTTPEKIDNPKKKPNQPKCEHGKPLCKICHAEKYEVNKQHALERYYRTRVLKRQRQEDKQLTIDDIYICPDTGTVKRVIDIKPADINALCGILKGLKQQGKQQGKL